MASIQRLLSKSVRIGALWYLQCFSISRCSIANRIGERIAELEQIVATVSDDVRTKVEIELRGLRLLNLQKQVPSTTFNNI